MGPNYQRPFRNFYRQGHGHPCRPEDITDRLAEPPGHPVAHRFRLSDAIGRSRHRSGKDHRIRAWSDILGEHQPRPLATMETCVASIHRDHAVLV